MPEHFIADPDLVRRHAGNGPRYFCYPDADRSIEALGPEAYGRWLENRSIGGFAKPPGLYVQLPLGDTLCHFEVSKESISIA